MKIKERNQNLYKLKNTSFFKFLKKFRLLPVLTVSGAILFSTWQAHSKQTENLDKPVSIDLDQVTFKFNLYRQTLSSQTYPTLLPKKF